MAEHPDKHGAHATIATYSLIALALFVITVIEVAVLYEPLKFAWPNFRIGVLVGLSILKFVLVVAFFMHLYYDAPVCTFLFSLGMVLAVGTMVALVHLFPSDLFPRSELRPEGKVKKPADQHAAAPEGFRERLCSFELAVEGV
ncbi:MAG: cytochrome C oxidase subunit IV family protein [Armatimonadetes bacterium]|nr:cytochrome C oxidase subunit IV family protein [Armatimonadota bacterium]